jgi:hypothetical protein
LYSCSRLRPFDTPMIYKRPVSVKEKLNRNMLGGDRPRRYEVVHSTKRHRAGKEAPKGGFARF